MPSEAFILPTIRLNSHEKVYNILCVSDYGICINFWNLVATLSLDGIDEGLQGIDGRHVVVFVDVLQCLKRRIQLRIQTVLNPMLEI